MGNVSDSDPPAIAKDIKVRCYGDGLNTLAEVDLRRDQINNRRLVVCAYAEGGYTRTEIDLLDLLDWCDGPGRDLIAIARAAQ